MTLMGACDRRVRLISVLALAACLAGCSGSHEHALLDRFFSASRLRNLTALSTVATVIFEPREHGTVLGFEITAVSPDGPNRKTVTVSALVRKPDGQQTHTLLLATLQRSSAGWIVTAVKDVTGDVARQMTNSGDALK